jgi:hypothetical protein
MAENVQAPVAEISRGLSNANLGPIDATQCSITALKELFQRQHRFLNFFFSN